MLLIGISLYIHNQLSLFFFKNISLKTSSTQTVWQIASSVSGKNICDISHFNTMKNIAIYKKNKAKPFVLLSVLFGT